MLCLLVLHVTDCLRVSDPLSILRMAPQDIDGNQGEPTIIRHGLKFGVLPEDVKQALVARGGGDPLTHTVRSFIRKDGVTAFPCLVVDPVTADIEGSMWALRGIAWEAGHKVKSVWGKAAPEDYSLVLKIPMDEVRFPGDSLIKSFSSWQDAFRAGWAQITGPDGRVVQDISGLPMVSK